MASLVDQFCPNVHDAPILAATFDPHSGTFATGDDSGRIAIQRPGERTPQLVFSMGNAPVRALGLVRGGSLVAVGDDDGSVAVYSTADGQEWFSERREGGRGRVRAMRGVALSPEGGRLAALGKDGLLRIWDIQRREREFAWSGFSGSSVEFGPRGQRLLAVDADGQVRLTDLLTVQGVYMDRLPTPAEFARFTVDGTMIVAAGPAGVSLLRAIDGALIGTFATRGGSGIVNLLLSPDGRYAGAITRNSVHVFQLPDLQPVDSRKHGAPRTTGAALWGYQGVRVAGDDGLLHAGGSGSAGPVTAVSGQGAHRLIVHNDKVAVWKDGKRVLEFAVQTPVRDAHINRDGRLAAIVPRRGPVLVYDCTTGRQVFDTGPDTSDPVEVAIGGNVVAVRPRSGGLRWWDLGSNRGYQLQWPRAMALSGGGTWLGVVTPKGRVRILDPASGTDALPAPLPLADVPVKRVAFVSRRPEMLVIDEEGVLGHYDLSQAARSGETAQGRDVLTVHGDVVGLWGIQGGEHCALSIADGDTRTLLWLDVVQSELVGEVAGLPGAVTVDRERGVSLEPARSSAVLERDQSGMELEVYRALPEGQWLSYGWRGLVHASAGFASAAQ